jgi:tetratricopeptide (TPR) repeat protein
MRTLSCTLCMAVLLAAAPAFAQDPAAKVHYEAGAQHYARGRYTEAISEFEEAYRLSKAAALLYNISQAYERLGDIVKAREYLKRYLDSGAAAADEKVALEDKLRVFDERIAKDEAAKANAATQPATQPVGPVEGIDTPMQFGIWKWVAIGGGGALLLTSAFFAYDGQQQEKKIEEAAESGNEPYTYASAWDRGERDDVLAWITGGIGVAALGAGVTMLLLENRGSDGESPSGTARVAPLVAPHAAGATVGWKW